MKRISTSITAFILMTCLLCGCSVSKGSADPDMQDVADAVFAASQINMDDMSQIPDDYVADIMQIDPTYYELRNTIISTIGINLNEYGIFKATSKENADKIATALNEYIDYRQDAWMDGYMPDEKPKLDNAEVWQRGNYVMYAILSDDARTAVKSAFESCFEG